MTKEQCMQAPKLHKQQGIKPAMNQTSTDGWITSLKAKLRMDSQPKDSVVKNRRESPKEPAWGHGGETKET